ncbi:MAG: hypothetical protein AAGA92_09830 [Planctomycetota bacterium]
MELDSAPISTLKLAGGALDASFPVSFEETFTALDALGRMDIEPDGFFVHSGEDSKGRWQIDGHLFDFGGRLHRLELSGHCPQEVFDQLLSCIGWPDTAVVFELIREGLLLDELTFRRAIFERQS